MIVGALGTTAVQRVAHVCTRPTAQTSAELLRFHRSHVAEGGVDSVPRRITLVHRPSTACSLLCKLWPHVARAGTAAVGDSCMLHVLSNCKSNS